MKKNREFIIGLLFLVAIAVMIGIWVDSQEKSTVYPTPKSNVESISPEAEIADIMETSDSTDLADLESEINLEINLDELDSLDTL